MARSYETLDIHLDDQVMYVTLNRPECRNAMSVHMIEELLDAEAGALDHGARLIVLRGAAGHFCSGGDIKDMSFRPDQTRDGKDKIAEVNARFGHLCLAYARSHLPIIAVVEGAVMGGGFGLSCVADVVIGSQTTVFRLPETGLGIIPAQIAPFLVERLGYSEARRLAVTGGKLDANRAYQIGLIHELCQDEAEIEAILAQTIAQIRKGAPIAIAQTKDLIRRARLESVEALIDDAANVFAKASRSSEGQEGIAAFLEKRPASWV